MSQTRIIEQWFYDRGEHELDRTLGEWYQALKFGPIPGAYFPIYFRGQDPLIQVVDTVVMPPLETAGKGGFEMRPIFFGAAVDGGNAEGNVEFDGEGGFVNVLTNDFVANILVSLNKREDFAVDKIVWPPDGVTIPNLRLRINSTAGASMITAILVCKEISQVEP